MEAQEHHTPRSTLPPTATNENNSRRPIEAQLITVWSLEVGWLKSCNGSRVSPLRLLDLTPRKNHLRELPGGHLRKCEIDRVRQAPEQGPLQA